MTTITPNRDILHQHVVADHGTLGSVDRQGQQTISNTVRALLGEAVNVKFVGSGVSSYQGAPHTTEGIPYAISGTATVIDQKITYWLAEFDDPIKAALGMAFYKTEKIIIVTTTLIGGDVSVIPEHAPGKTMSRQESSREIVTSRHGNDFVMNLNLFLIPEKANEHLTDYLNGQRLGLERALVSIGYETLFREGTRLAGALMRSNPIASLKSPLERVVMADRLFVETIFGAFSKQQFALQNVMTQVGKVNHYTPTGSSRSPYKLMIVPMGFREFDRTKPETMYHFISGLPGRGKEPVAIPLNVTAYSDPVTGLRVMTHVPVSGFQSGGTGDPQVECNEMQSIESFAMYYMQRNKGDAVGVRCVITDFKHRDWKELPFVQPAAGGVGNDATGANEYVFFIRPQMTCVMDRTVIIANPGSETGEFVVQWPSTGISTSQTGETLRGKFRVYMQAYLKNPENVLILDCIKFAGIVAGEGTRICPRGERYNEDDHDLLQFVTDEAPWDYVNLWDDQKWLDQCRQYGIFKSYIGVDPANPYAGGAVFQPGDRIRKLDAAGSDRSGDIPAIFYRGTTKVPGKNQIRSRCNGHLGVLDHPNNVLAIEGAQIFGNPEFEMRGANAVF